MRKLIVSNAVSLDGYYTGPDDNVMIQSVYCRLLGETTTTTV
jgi:hypothetical protein